MFMTQFHKEELLGRPFAQEQFWPFVELSRNDLWYYVSTAHSRIGGKAQRCYLLTEVADLVKLIEETSDEFWIERVMVVVPPRMNGTGCWKMHQLKELIAVVDNTDLIVVDYVYKLADDLSYETRQTPEDATVTWRQVLFSEQQHAYLDESA
jgi:hypothetical protein